MQSVERENLSAELAERVRQLVATGAIGLGERINEVRLAARLNVSRTPLREALSRLASEGIVTSRPRRGFFVREPGVDEVRQLYGMRAILDPAALELAGLPTRRQLDRLAALNARIAASRGDVLRAIDLDDRWHLELLSHCPNEILLDLIRRFMRRTRPLEHAYLRDHTNLAVATAEHRLILEPLKAGDLSRGVAALRRNMRSGLDPLLEWLRRTREAATVESEKK